MRRIAKIGVAAFFLSAASAQKPLTPEEARGREVYERGVSPSSSPIEALIAGDTRVPGAIVPCVNCHGRDGLGKPEGGVSPSNVTWEALTKPYGVAHADGRTHPPYTERLLIRAITIGADPAGNELNRAMPRFTLSRVDADSLVAYFKLLGNVSTPGVSADTVRLGVVLAADAGSAVRQILLDYYARLNGGGGIFGRRIELAFTTLPPERAKHAEALRAFLWSESVFALLADFSGSEPAMTEVVRESDTPAIAALAAFPENHASANRQVFYLDDGIPAEIAALVRFSTERFPGDDRPISVVAADDEIAREAAVRIRRELIAVGRQRVSIISDHEAVSGDVVFWTRRDLAIADTGLGAPILIPGSLLNPSAIFAASTRVFVALSETPRGGAKRALASAALASEAMRASGRGLTRANFCAALEDLLRAPRNPVRITTPEMSTKGFTRVER